MTAPEVDTLDERYRAAATEEPSPDLDRQVLDQARLAAPGHRPPVWPPVWRFLLPMLAASGVSFAMVAGIPLLLLDGRAPEGGATSPVPESVSVRLVRIPSGTLASVSGMDEIRSAPRVQARDMAPPDPAAAWDRIRRLQAEGLVAEAAQARARLQAAHPDWTPPATHTDGD